MRTEEALERFKQCFDQVCISEIALSVKNRWEVSKIERRKLKRWQYNILEKI